MSSKQNANKWNGKNQPNSKKNDHCPHLLFCEWLHATSLSHGGPHKRGTHPMWERCCMQFLHKIPPPISHSHPICQLLLTQKKQMNSAPFLLSWMVSPRSSSWMVSSQSQRYLLTLSTTCDSLDPYSYLMVAVDFFSLLSLCLFVFYGFFFIAMGGSTFFFVESKTFEFSLEEGGTFYL